MYPCFLPKLTAETLPFQTQHEREYKRRQGLHSASSPILTRCTFSPSLSSPYLLLPSKAEGTCDFLILVPLRSLSFLSVSVTKVSVTFSGFLCVSRPPYLSSLCSAILDRCLSQCCHWVPCSGLASRCICHLTVSNTSSSAFTFINLSCSCSNCIYAGGSM